MVLPNEPSPLFIGNQAFKNKSSWNPSKRSPCLWKSLWGGCNATYYAKTNSYLQKHVKNLNLSNEELQKKNAKNMNNTVDVYV